MNSPPVIYGDRSDVKIFYLLYTFNQSMALMHLLSFLLLLKIRDSVVLSNQLWEFRNKFTINLFFGLNCLKMVPKECKNLKHILFLVNWVYNFFFFFKISPPIKIYKQKNLNREQKPKIKVNSIWKTSKLYPIRLNDKCSQSQVRGRKTLNIAKTLKINYFNFF